MAQKLSQNWGLLFLALAALCRSLCQTFVRTPPSAPWPLPQALRRWRQDFLSINHGLDPTGLVSSIFLGEDKACPRPVLDLFRSMGLSHMLAASGFNCWIVSQMLRLAARPMARALGGKVNRWDAIASVAGAGLFWCWSDQSPPVTRALLTTLISATATTLGVRIPLPRLVILQYCGSLVLDPRLFRHAGFQLTHACLLGLIAGEHYTRKWFPALPRWVAPSLGGSLGATLAALPITWAFFAELNFNGVLLTPLISPVVAAGLMPLALMQMFVLLLPHPWGDSIAQCLGQLNSIIAWFLLRVLELAQAVLPSLRYAPYWD